MKWATAKLPASIESPSEQVQNSSLCPNMEMRRAVLVGGNRWHPIIDINCVNFRRTEVICYHLTHACCAGDLAPIENQSEKRAKEVGQGPGQHAHRARQTDRN